MRAPVVAFNPHNGFAAVRTPGGITVFELLGSEVEVGDIVSGELESLGGETFLNESQGERIDVFVQDIYCSEQVASRLLSG